MPPAAPFDELIATAICETIASSDRGLKSICKDHEISASSFYVWLTISESDNKGLVERYARAREAQQEFLAEQILEIADDSSDDAIETKFGPIENKEFVNRSKLRVETRKWLMSKLAPKKYGDKQQLEVSGTLDLASRLSAARERKVPKK